MSYTLTGRYVNLPLSWVHGNGDWVDFFWRRGLNPELGFDSKSLGLPKAWHQDLAHRLKCCGLHCSVHLPFFAPPLGQGDEKCRREGLDTLKKAAELAGIYEAGHLVGHPSFFACSDADGAKAHPGDIGPRPSAGWLERSVEDWRQVLAVTDARLYLENTYDSGPEAVLALLDELAREKAQIRAGMCFDLGHWFSFAQGCDRRNLDDWLDKIAPHLAHLHLHDNAGHSDQHLGLGQGSIPLEDFFGALGLRGLSPTFTLEPHDVNALEHSLAWLAARAGNAVV